jgi:hypothetical protein
MDARQQLLFGKTSPECSPPRTTPLAASSADFLGSMTPLKLKTGSGLKQAFSVAKPSEWVIESSMPNTLPWLKGVGGSFSLPCLVSLSQVLESGPVHQRYFLSEKACSGILRRAEKRGKQLPETLRQALQSVVDAANPSTLTEPCSTKE